MTRTSIGLVIAFGVAGGGLLVHGWARATLDTWLGIAALGLLLVDQARMAMVDLANIQVVRRYCTDRRLVPFARTVAVTIGSELVGFWLAGVALQWGASIVLLSQVGFNLTAKIALYPETDEPIKPWGIIERLPVLVADGLALAIALAWAMGFAPILMAGLLLGMAIAYLAFKYFC